MPAVKVVIADDHAIWRSGLRSDLGDNFTVVGEAADAKEAVALVEATDPDLVLSDLHMPHGFSCRSGRQPRSPKVPVPRR